MTTYEGHPVVSRMAPNAIPTADTIITDPRPRCQRCGHPIEAHRSVARGLGPRCWARTALAQLDRRRDDLGARLTALARRVGQMDAAALNVALAALDDLLDGGVR